jgi:hypothetical protein
MGGEIDCMNLVSSMTLFQHAAEESNDLEVGAITERVLALRLTVGQSARKQLIGSPKTGPDELGSVRTKPVVSLLNQSHFTPPAWLPH